MGVVLKLDFFSSLDRVINYFNNCVKAKLLGTIYLYKNIRRYFLSFKSATTHIFNPSNLFSLDKRIKSQTTPIFPLILRISRSIEFRNYAFKQGKSSGAESIGRAFQRMSTSHPFVKIEFGKGIFTIDSTYRVVNVLGKIMLC